jgi:hypothetical protein
MYVARRNAADATRLFAGLPTRTYLWGSDLTMAFWKSLLAAKNEPEPVIAFGRYSDAYKSQDRFSAFDTSLKQYEEGRFADSVRSFAEYLRNRAGDNTQVREQDGVFCLDFYQGSKQVQCLLNDRVFRAEAKIAHCKTLNVGFLRKAIEYNYQLNYSRFALDPDNNLCMLFDSLLSECSPHKLYFGLKELSLQSDKEDDLLLSEFDQLQILHNQHIKHPDRVIAQTKIRFVRNKLNEIEAPEVLGSLNPRRFQGALTYVYLAALYSIDYLVKPEGVVMDIIGRVHQRYFGVAPDNIDEKIAVLRDALKELAAVEDSQLDRELYEVISTFGVTSSVSQDVIAQFIDAEMQSLKWYAENGHDRVCQAICNYVAAYSLYNFALPGPDHDLMHLYFEVVENKYFRELGYKVEYMSRDGHSVDLGRVNQRIAEILRVHRTEHPGLPVNPRLAQVELPAFSQELLLFIRNLQLST